MPELLDYPSPQTNIGRVRIADQAVVVFAALQSMYGTAEHHPYLFSNAAEHAWTKHAYQLTREDLKVNRYITFPLHGRDCIRIADGIMQFNIKGRSEQITPAEIAEYRLLEGVFYIRHKDARWFSSAGKYRFGYGGREG